MLVLHESCIDQHVAISPARQHEGKGQIDPALVIHAGDEIDPWLAFGPGIFQHEDFPWGIGHGVLTFRLGASGKGREGPSQVGGVGPRAQRSASMRPRLDRPTAMIRIAPCSTYCEKVGAPKMLRPLKPKTMISAPMNVPRTWNSPSRSVAEPRK